MTDALFIDKRVGVYYNTKRKHPRQAFLYAILESYRKEYQWRGKMNRMNWLFLIVAIISESIATNSLKASNGFTNVVPSIVALVGYGSVLFFLSLAIRTIPVGLAYATWSGIGIILIAMVGWLWHRQSLDVPAIIGMGLIIAGVVIINVFSNSVTR